MTDTDAANLEDVIESRREPGHEDCGVVSSNNLKDSQLGGEQIQSYNIPTT
jgi:hypothetical protein